MTARSLTRKPAVLAASGAALVALAGGGAAVWAGGSHTLTLSVDGVDRTVTTRAGTVAGVLAAAKLTAGEHDLLAPAAGTPVQDGTRIALRHGRPLELVVDGTKKTVWVTAESVGEALDQVGVGTRGAVLSASRSRRLPLEGLALDVRTAKAVAILVDGHVRTLTTTAPTVRDALIAAKVKLGRLDRLSDPRETPLTDHAVIRVTRVEGRRVQESLEIPFPTTSRPDDSTYEGETSVLQEGSPGVLVRTYTVNYVDGQQKSKFLGSEVQEAEPVPRILGIGTRSRPQAAPAAGSYASSGGGLNWAALANCESGGNPRARSSNGRYFGLYQFDYGTWAGVGGSGSPADASAEEQTARAQRLYDSQGRAPWPVCGRNL